MSGGKNASIGLTSIGKKDVNNFSMRCAKKHGWLHVVTSLNADLLAVTGAEELMPGVLRVMLAKTRLALETTAKVLEAIKSTSIWIRARSNRCAKFHLTHHCQAKLKMQTTKALERKSKPKAL